MLIQRVVEGRGLSWVTEGFALFRAAPLLWMVVSLLFLAVLSLLSMVPLFGSIAATLLQPVLVAGLLQGCRDLDRGQELRIEHLFSGFSEKTKPLMMVGLLLGLASIGVVLVLAAAVFGTGVLGSAMMDSADWADGMPQLTDRATLGVLFLLTLGLLLSVPVAMAGWFAPALVMFDDVDAWDALRASFIGCLRNVWPFLIYGIALLLLLFIALVPFGLGLLLWIPMLFGSLYVSYNDIYRSVP